LTQDEEQSLATLTYRVRLNDKGKLEWHSRIDNQDVIETKEPLTGWWLRFKAWWMKIAPESHSRVRLRFIKKSSVMPVNWSVSSVWTWIFPWPPAT
jgi:hypothetical protein